MLCSFAIRRTSSDDRWRSSRSTDSRGSPAAPARAAVGDGAGRPVGGAAADSPEVADADAGAGPGLLGWGVDDGGAGVPSACGAAGGGAGARRWGASGVD